MTVLFVSPHLDDVALSCPGHVLAARAEGEEVAILTLFSDGDDSASYDGRRAEDREAARALGARAIHAGLLDAPARRGHPPTFRALVLTPLARDEDDARAVTRVLERALEEMQPTRIVAPLGVGHHVDHRVVHDACRALGATHFYEDQPYALVQHALRFRLDALGAHPAWPPPPEVATPVDRAALRASLAAAPFAAAYLPSGPERDAVLDEATLPPPRPRRGCIAAVASQLSLGKGALHAAHLALRAYPSQLAAVLGGRDALPRQVETLWTLED